MFIFRITWLRWTFTSFPNTKIAGNLFAKATARDLNHDLALSGA